LTCDLAMPTTRGGRPPGKAQVWREAGLRLHDLSFMRAVVQGLAPAVAAQRYLPELMADERVADAYLRRVVELAADILVSSEEPGAASVMLDFAKFPKSQVKSTACENTPSAQLEPAVPSLDEFAEEIGAEDFSEREIQELYQERYGEQLATLPAAADTSAPIASTDTVLRALGIVQSRGVVLPKPTDPVRLWFSQSLTARLNGAEIVLLQELIDFINRYGRHWYSRIPGVGQDRARRLVGWLVQHEPFLEHKIAPRSRWDSASHLAGGDSVWTALQPFFKVAHAAQTHLGSSLRSTGPNAMGVQSEADAVKSWLVTLDFKSVHTRKAYACDVMRLMLWAQEQGKTLSTLTVADAAAHARFLCSPPAHWIGRLPAHRDWADWRPMRGPLSSRSAARALAAIGHLYGFLMETGYLVANPFARIRQSKQPDQQIDTMRSLSMAQMRMVEQYLGAMQESPTSRRLVAILALLESTGLRIGELNLTWGNLMPIRLLVPDEQLSGAKCLRVLGKGGKERLVPIKEHVLRALHAHRADRQVLIESGLVVAVTEEETPLFSVLERPMVGEMASANGALSTAGLHRVVKRLFAQVAGQCADAESKAAFERATCHWLRHTFAHSVLGATNQDLPVTQQLLGHKSIATTGIYVKADMGQRLRAVMAMPLMFGGNSQFRR
jgi:site-specific recombinase XerD